MEREEGGGREEGREEGRRGRRGRRRRRGEVCVRKRDTIEDRVRPTRVRPGHRRQDRSNQAKLQQSG